MQSFRNATYTVARGLRCNALARTALNDAQVNTPMNDASYPRLALPLVDVDIVRHIANHTKFLHAIFLYVSLQLTTLYTQTLKNPNSSHMTYDKHVTRVKQIACAH